MNKSLAVLFFLLISPSLAQSVEPPNFSLMGNLGAGEVLGFLGSGTPAPCGGLWFGVRLNDRFDGLWAADYYTMPSQEVTVGLTPSSSNNYATSMNVLPTDDFALTANARWYWADKYDRVHQRFNTVPYLLVGAGMDLVLDQDPVPPNTAFYAKSYDILFSLNLGAGMDLPLGDGKKWFLYVEGMEHLIFWQGLTAIYSGRVGLKVMLDSEHVDILRGVL